MFSFQSAKKQNSDGMCAIVSVLPLTKAEGTDYQIHMRISLLVAMPN
jgi:hypothetical protein